MNPTELHADSIVIDGLIIAKWNRELAQKGMTPAGREFLKTA